MCIYDPITASIHPGHEKQLAHSAPSQPAIDVGSRLDGLRFDRLVGQTAFFHLSMGQSVPVFCRLLNLVRTAKALRGFMQQPPEAQTVMEQPAIVLATATDDRHASPGCLRSPLPEVTFLGEFAGFPLDHVHMKEKLTGDPKQFDHLVAGERFLSFVLCV